MWLINAETLKLEYFIDPEVEGIQYAILSHTWGPDEVSFQDFADLLTATHKAGFAKIKATCDLALADGYHYAWVDTCCIDKSSSAELSEAINSMFNWYQLSAVCYAYLVDLDGDPFGGLPAGFEELSKDALAPLAGAVLETQFAKCRWFTRGWTLQELIAPFDLVFYDASWRRVCDKRTIRHVLKLITHVSVKILIDSTRLRTKSVWQRMSWVARRHTTRTEDIAYCLLGIFDVNLPLLYGEGHKAFQRLQEEITRKEGDPSILLWSSEKMPLPQYRPAEFRGLETPPLLRGAFAWAPSEFLSHDAYARAVSRPRSYNSNHLANPATLEMGPQSSVVLRNGITRFFQTKDYNGECLEIYTPKHVFYRSVYRTNNEYVLARGPVHDEATEIKYEPSNPPRELIFLAQHKTMMLDASVENFVPLGIDIMGRRVKDIRAWPEKRWNSVWFRWIYTRDELLRLRKSPPLVLGVVVMQVPVKISIESPMAATTEVSERKPSGLVERGFTEQMVASPSKIWEIHKLRISCSIGYRPKTDANTHMRDTLPSLIAFCAVDDPYDKRHTPVYPMLDDGYLSTTVDKAQDVVNEPDDRFNTLSGRSVIVEISTSRGARRVRMTCFYPGDGTSDLIDWLQSDGFWEVNIKLEYEAVYDSNNWTDVVVPFESE